MPEGWDAGSSTRRSRPGGRWDLVEDDDAEDDEENDADGWGGDHADVGDVVVDAGGGDAGGGNGGE